jgi:hypothetical protein
MANSSLNGKIESLFETAGLAEGDRNMWRSKLESLDESYVELFVAIYENEPEILAFMTENTKSRILAGDDSKALEEICDREKVYIERFKTEGGDKRKEKDA